MKKASQLQTFTDALLCWFDQHGRHDLPWQHPRSPYFVWLSEIMLQQTQVATVKAYFVRFIARFPTLAALAQAQLDDLLALWAGLGYYSRARNLHACAQRCVSEHGGELPNDLSRLMALPGIGRSTAAAILSQAFNQRAAILDGNVKRVLARQVALLSHPGTRAGELLLWQQADARLPPLQDVEDTKASQTRFANYTQALMDLGALICTPRKPRCGICPVSHTCQAHLQNLAHELPVKKARQLKPTRHITWLIARNALGQVLMLRRPELGIWGGLYALPEAEDAADFLAQNLPLQGLELQASLPAIKHVFTHFTLFATPVLGAARADVGVADAGFVWVDREQASHLGMPAPIKALVGSVFSL
jgi:A/G-specific adenine glycosylase